jgi:HTH-type transcriptional regulator, quorum sensing regulator NprR
MLKHVLGMYYFLIGKYQDCIQILIPSTKNNTSNMSITTIWHLPIISFIQIFSYYYAERALHYFRKTLNVIRVIDTETIMLLQLNAKELHDFVETKDRYEQLIRTCDSINVTDRKSKLLHNLAFELAKRKKYEEAAKLYKDAMKLMDEKSQPYLTALDGYIASCYKGQLLPNETLLKLASKGLHLANSTKSFHSIFFELHMHQLNQDEGGHILSIHRNNSTSLL